MYTDIKQLVKVDNIDEANSYLAKGWALLETGSTVIDNVFQHFFIIGKTGNVELQEIIERLE